MKHTQKNIACSFCSRQRAEVSSMISIKSSGQKVCSECIEICYSVIKRSTLTSTSNIKNLRPIDIYNKLDELVEGQEEAKKTLAVAAYNHYKRILNDSSAFLDIEIEKSNVLMIGPSGCGKTLLCMALANIMELPIVIVDATTLTEAGYVGKDVDSCIEDLLRKADFSVDLAQGGIVVVDECDKIARSGDAAGQKSKDVSGEGVQQGFLKLMEGTVVSVPVSGSKKTMNQETIQVDTKNIMFIFTGAFPGLERIVEKDIGGSRIGFNTMKSDKSHYDTVMKNLKNEHLIKYGFINEIIGRLPIHVVLKELTKADLVNIMTRTKNAILKQYKKLLYIKDKAKLIWTPEALEIIAENVISSGVGARGLKSIIEKILLPTMFEIPGENSSNTRVIIDEQVARNLSGAKIEIEEKAIAVKQ